MDQLTYVFRGLLGIAAFLGLAVLFSENRRAIPWKLVGAGLGLQIVLGFLVLRVGFIRQGIEATADLFNRVLQFNEEGSRFLFGGLVGRSDSFGYIFAFNVLPTIIFFSALTSLLFYLGILQKIVHAFAWLLSRTMQLSGAESLSASANVFLGQTEAPLLIKHYLPTMTRSELLAVMIGGMANIAGAVFIAYMGFLGGSDEAQRTLFGTHLITASIMSAPASLFLAKMLLPQTEPVSETLSVSDEKMGANALEAVSIGTTDGVKLAVNVGAMLLVFTALIAMLNWLLGMAGGRWGADSWHGLNEWIAASTSGRYDGLSLQYLLGLLFAPVAWLMGIDSGSLMVSGQLLGEKTVLNEFFAYGTLGRMKDAGIIADARTQIILTYALCGFANFASIGIQVGGIGVLAPNQRPVLAKLGMKALLGGTLATFMGASIAGMMI